MSVFSPETQLKSTVMGKYPLYRHSILIVITLFFVLILVPVHAEPDLTNKESDLYSSLNSPVPCIGLAENESMMVDPVITVRFSNPRFYCDTSRYIVDVEFQSNTANKEIFGMNVRFWYDDNLLEFVRFQGFPSSYGAVAPSPPTVTSVNVGTSWFGFPTIVADYVNGAMQKTSTNATPIYISTNGWTKLFSIVFHVDDPNADYSNFYASVIGDLELNPANGGFLPGNDGIVITLVNTSGGSLPATENTIPLNWVYQGSGAAPYGHTSFTTMAPFYNCAPPITCPANVTIACGSSTLPAVLGTATSADYCIAGTPVITYSDVQSGGVCPQSNLITRIWSATDSCNNHSYCQQYITVGAGSCSLIVTNDNDSGTGSLRDAINCALSGDTITFHSSLAGTTILINTTKFILNKNLYLRSNITPRVKIKSTVPGLFDIAASKSIEFKDLDIISGIATTNNDGAAFNNLGTLKLIGVKVYRNTALPTGQYLIRNKPGSQSTLSGSCFIQNN
ncbi:MAG: hypothetical protein ABJB16_17455 [Saprospiraceae bacterium]